MKNLFIIFFLIFLNVSLIAQQPAPCGTEISPEWMEAFYNRDKSHLNQDLRGGNLPRVDIPIIYHILGEDDGSGYFELPDLFRLHCDMQAEFLAANMHFYVLEINYIDDTDYFNGESTNQLFNIYNNREALNVFIVDDMQGVCGYSYVPQPHDGFGWSGPNRGGIMLQQGCIGSGSTTYAHEAGHYFNLPHTFYGWEGEDSPSTNQPAPNSINGSLVERVNGSNCLNAGDGFCDTPPDYISDRWNCNSPRSFQDPNGTSFQVDEENFMSYANDACTEYFSDDQYAEMNAAPANFRSYLLDLSVPDVTPLNLIVETQPNNVDNISATAVLTLKWDNIERADMYLLEVTTGNFFNPLIEEILEDTFFVIDNLIADEEYEWRVRPISYNYMCSDYSEVARFSTASFGADIEVFNVNCPNSFDGSATVSSSTSGNFVASWNSEDFFVDSQISGESGLTLSNVSSGDYFVYVINDDLDTATIYFTIEAPTEITIDLQQVDNVIEADINGGVPPYTIIWNNGDGDTLVENPIEGLNDMLLVDQNGCQKTASIDFTPISTSVNINNIDQVINGISLFPNPLNSNLLMVSINSKTQNQAILRLVDAQGKLINQVGYELNSGENPLRFETSNLANGLYLLNIEIDGFSKSERVIVMK